MAMGTNVSLVRINRKWTPRVRYAARRYKRAHRKALRKFERSIKAGKSEGDAISILCAEQASIVLEMLNRLGYGGDRKMAPARDRLELEIQVHMRDEDASINFFRLFLAQRKNRPLSTVFSRKGRQRFQERAEAARWQHIKELETTLKARNAAHAWLGQYFGRLELGKKYREFTRVRGQDGLHGAPFRPDLTTDRTAPRGGPGGVQHDGHRPRYNCDLRRARTGRCQR